MKNWHIITGLIVVAIALIGISKVTQERAASTDPSVVSTRGIHWHPHLSIVVRGEEVVIPTNIGLSGEHNPMHTHDTDGIIHLEYEGVVREEDIRLGKFFELWGVPFSKTQIMEYENTEEEQVRMFVNGEENFEYEDYRMQHEDEIEIRYE